MASIRIFCLIGIWPVVNALFVELVLSADEYMRVYEGSAKNVSAIAHDGRRVSFPAHILRPYVTHEGINGCFRIVFDAENRFQRIDRV